MLYIVTKYISQFSQRKLWRRWTVLLIIGFILPTVYFGKYHQTGTLSVMSKLAAEAQVNSNMSVLFLMPCHSTPLYSHIHSNITTRFLTCEPPIDKEHYDESEDFYAAPVEWLTKNWPVIYKSNDPSHIVCFDSVLPVIRNFLKKHSYIINEVFEHTMLPEERTGTNVILLKKTIKNI